MRTSSRPRQIDPGNVLIRGLLSAVPKDAQRLLKTPQTVVDRSRDQFVGFWEEQGGDGLEAALKHCFFEMGSRPLWEQHHVESCLRAAIKKELRQVRQRTCGACFLTLWDAAHAGVRNSQLLALPNPVDHNLATLSAIARLAELRLTRREERARLLLQTGSEIAEQLYRPFLEALWKLSHLASGQRPPAPPKFGRLVQELERRLGECCLVERDAAHLRNAVAHNRWTYLPKTNEVETHDLNGWSRTMSLRELERTVRKMERLACDIWPKAAHAFLQEKVALPIISTLPAMCSPVVDGTMSPFEAIAITWKREMSSVWSDVARLQG